MERLLSRDGGTDCPPFEAKLTFYPGMRDSAAEVVIGAHRDMKKGPDVAVRAVLLR
jgi:hypothetical protein